MPARSQVGRIGQNTTGLLWGSGSNQQSLPNTPRAGQQSFAQAAVNNINGGSLSMAGTLGAGQSLSEQQQQQQLQQQQLQQQRQQQVTSLDPSDFPALGAAVGSHIHQPPPQSMASQQQHAPQNFSQVAQASLFSRMDNSLPAPDSSSRMGNSGGPPGLQSSRTGMTSSSQAVGGPRPSSSGSNNNGEDKQTDDFPALPDPTSKASTETNGSKSSHQQQQNDMEKFGMNGLQGVIRMENNDQTAVAIGNDLTSLGLDVNPNGTWITKSFASPWLEAARFKPEPAFKLPACYDVPSAVTQQLKVQSFSEETLFYIFYTMPRDAMQEAAAVELTNRNWRYHKELKMWLTKDPMSEPIQRSGQAEQGIYIFFDPQSWEKVKREYYLFYPAIA